MVEQRPGPVDKACGEGLMPGAVRALEELVGPLNGFPLQGIRYLDDGSRCAEARFTHGPGLGVRRTVLHGALEKAAATRGSCWWTGSVGDVTQDDVRGAGRRRAGPLPRGRRRPALRHPLRGGSLTRAGASGPARCGLRRHFAVSALDDLVEVTWASRSEAYVTPVGPDLVGVAVLTSRARLVRRPPAGVPGAGRAAAATGGDRRCAGRVRCGSARAGRWPGGCCWSATPPATWTR